MGLGTQHDIGQYDMVQHSVVRYFKVQCSLQCSTVLYSTAQHSTAQHSAATSLTSIEFSGSAHPKGTHSPGLTHTMYLRDKVRGQRRAGKDGTWLGIACV
jgi:hypothetical protein